MPSSRSPVFSRKSKKTVAENLCDSPAQAIPDDHIEESQGVAGIGKELWNASSENTALEEVKLRKDELEKEELSRLRKEVDCKANPNRQVQYPMWRGNVETCLGLHPYLQSSPLDSTAKSSCELWIPLDHRRRSLRHTRHKENISPDSPIHVWNVPDGFRCPFLEIFFFMQLRS